MSRAGAILYDLLTGRPPFRSDSPTATLSLVLNAAPEKPRVVNGAVPRDLETVALKCLEKDPANRYASAEALAAFWAFTWEGLIAFLVLFVLVGQLGVGLAYHRLLCHRSYQVPGRCGTSWPGWEFWRSRAARSPGARSTASTIATPTTTTTRRYRTGRSGSRTCSGPWSAKWPGWPPPATSAASRQTCSASRPWAGSNGGSGPSTPGRRSPCCWPAGGFGGWGLGLSLLLWGFFLRVVAGWHVMCLVNSINHHHSYRNYATDDDSTTCWWVALLTFGEGWHHHHRPRCAAHGHRWFEADTSYRLLRLLEWLGLATRVVHPDQPAVAVRRGCATISAVPRPQPSQEVPAS